MSTVLEYYSTLAIVAQYDVKNPERSTSFIVVQFRNSIQLIFPYDNRTAQVSLNFE